jgi:predicted ATP-grasp superfamily ATP-dependent carboligase
MMKHTERILVLDGHTNQALACVRSLGPAGYKVFVASNQRFPLAAWSRYCAGSYQIKEQGATAFACLREWACRQNIQIVLPLTERSCLLCNSERERWETSGVILGCGPNEMLFNAFDKARTLTRAQACDIEIPLTRYPASFAECLAAVDEVGFPCVVKPRWSCFLNEGYFPANRTPAYVDEIEVLKEVVMSRRQGTDWPLIQEFVAGQGKGIFALCDRGRTVALFGHERLRETRPTGSGSSLRRSVPMDPRMREATERLLSELNWHGPAMVEFKDDGTRPRLMEINGRFWGSLQLGIDAGVNFPLLWVKILKGEPVEQITRYEENLPLRWLLGDVKRFIKILGGAPAGYAGAYPSIKQGLKELFGPQPPGTRLEAWRAHDPLPAFGEWASGSNEFLIWLKSKLGDQRVLSERAMPPLATENKNKVPGLARNYLSTNVVIREASAQEKLEWDKLVSRFDNHRVLHQLSWLRSLEAFVKGKPLFLVYQRDGEIVGCMPGFLVRLGFLRMFGSPLPGWQTMSMGPVFDPARISTEELMVPLVSFLRKNYGVHHIEVIASNFDKQVMEGLRFTGTPSPSYCVPLYPGDENRVMKAFKDSARRNVKRAIKLGLVVKFEQDEAFMEEHYDQLVEVYHRGGNVIPFTRERAFEFFRYMKQSGNLVAVSVSLPDGGPCIATGTFTIEGRELLLWMWAHRTRYRWYRPTELMTWTVMQKAMEAGCHTLDLMGRGDFKPKLGAILNEDGSCWIWSRYQLLTQIRLLAKEAYKWQQSVRGRRARIALFDRLSAEGAVDKAKVSQVVRPLSPSNSEPERTNNPLKPEPRLRFG